MPNDSRSDLPGITKELVEKLEAMFPDRCPAMGDTLEKIWLDAGSARVVRKIRFEFEHQNETIIPPGTVVYKK